MPLPPGVLERRVAQQRALAAGIPEAELLARPLGRGEHLRAQHAVPVDHAELLRELTVVEHMRIDGRGRDAAHAGLIGAVVQIAPGNRVVVREGSGQLDVVSPVVDARAARNPGLAQRERASRCSDRGTRRRTRGDPSGSVHRALPRTSAGDRRDDRWSRTASRRSTKDYSGCRGSCPRTGCRHAW